VERGPLSLVSTIQELLVRKSRGSFLENRHYGLRGSAALTTRHPLIHKKLTLISPTSGGRSRTKAKDLSVLTASCSSPQ
jgi:hypothetical protein